METTEEKKRKIGIIGGVGPQATVHIYQQIIELSQSKYGAMSNDDYPRLIIESVPVPDFISDKGRIGEASLMLSRAVGNLSASGSSVIAIGSNTVHVLLKELSMETGVQFISMIKLVAEKCAKDGFYKVGLLGSSVLLESGVYEKEMRNKGVEVILPDGPQMEAVEGIIRQVLSGEVEDDSKKEYISILNKMISNGADAVILGCTELPIAVNYEVLGNRVISSSAVLAEGLVDYYYS